MGILVGTIVKPYEPAEEVENGYFTCELYETNKMDSCVGIVTELGDYEAKVYWWQFCRYHINESPTHEWCKYDNLWEIGLLT